MSAIDNRFTIHVATVNGSGSQTANTTLLRALFQMGIPVSGKNLFPSNIQGLPTWYEIRVNKHGYTARALEYDLMVAMNAQTYARDVREVRSGGYLFHDSSWPLDALNDMDFKMSTPHEWAIEGIELLRLCIVVLCRLSPSNEQ